MKWLPSLALLAILAAALWIGMIAWRSSPTPTSGPSAPATLPTITPDNRIDSLIAALTPTATRTPKPTGEPYASRTPYPQCSETTAGICDNWSPTPTRTPQPTMTPPATIAPCSVESGARYCLQTGEGE